MLQKLLSLIVFVFLFSLCSLTSVSAGFQEVFNKYLEIGPATALKLNTHGVTASKIDSKLLEIYQYNNLKPLWIENGKPEKRAHDILVTLENSINHGLNPSDYFVRNIRLFWKSNDLSSLAQLDILLTLGMLRYVVDQREGRIEPKLIDPKLFATAHDVEIDREALFSEALKAPDMNKFLERQAPQFFQYRRLVTKLAEYRKIAGEGGWKTIPDGPALQLGMTGDRVTPVRKRLAVTGEFEGTDLNSVHFDKKLAEGIRTFQKRHNLTADGVLGKKTLTAMNVSVSSRITQIIVNMERYRWLKPMDESRIVAVNIAGFEAYAGKSGEFDLSMPVIVGKTYHETPVFNDFIKYVEINPYWTLPPSIARNETLPKLQQDPSYLVQNKMRLFKGWGNNAPELDSTAIDWSQVSPRQMNAYRIRQDPGPHNALGTLKLVFPNQYDVYLHDTPSHELFNRERRAFSHGCIRLSRPAEMAAYVLGGEENKWTKERIKAVVQSRKRTIVKPQKPVPIIITYRTAVVNKEDQAIYFYEDIYGRDALLANAILGKKL